MSDTPANVKALLESALVYADKSHTADDVAQLVAEGKLQAWYGPGAVVITEVITYPQYRVCNVFLAAGSLREIQAMQPGIEEWARSQGCARMVFTGRKGWGRTFLINEGYGSQLEVFTKVL